MSDDFDIEAHRLRLVYTIDAIAAWRQQMSREADNPIAKKASGRVYLALRVLSSFVRHLPADDPDLRNLRLARIYQHPGGWDAYQLDEEALTILNRFWINKGASQRQHAQPTDEQMRNVLRQADGAEQRRRSEARQRAEAGYGDD